MGFSPAKIPLIPVLLILALFPVFLSSQEIGTRAKIRSFTMPQYHEKDNRLQFIVYGKSADNKGALLLLDDMVIDFIRNGLNDINQVKMLPDVLPYPLDAPAADIRAYWRGKTHSQGLVFSDAAALDKNTRMLRSDQKVKFRSNFLDVDGVGFDADQSRKFLHIRSNVKLKIRSAPEKRPAAEVRRKSAEDYYEQEIKQNPSR